MKKVRIDGVDYYARQPGNRAVVVVDRGWIFAGDITETETRIRIDRAVWVFRWEKIGFAGVLENPSDRNADIRSISEPIDLPKESEVFRIPVPDDWGL